MYFIVFISYVFHCFYDFLFFVIWSWLISRYKKLYKWPKLYICIIQCHIQSMRFPLITYGMALYTRLYTDKTIKSRKSMNMRASVASELNIFDIFTIWNCYFLHNCCWYFRYFLSETFIFSSQILSAYIIHNQCTFLNHL